MIYQAAAAGLPLLYKSEEVCETTLMSSAETFDFIIGQSSETTPLLYFVTKTRRVSNWLVYSAWQTDIRDIIFGEPSLKRYSFINWLSLPTEQLVRESSHKAHVVAYPGLLLMEVSNFYIFIFVD